MMSSVRRTLGGFLLALVVASGLVLTPRQAQAQDLNLYCSLLLNAIQFWASKPHPPQGLLEKLYEQYNTYCSSAQ
jgi:hypothetical protein